MEEGAVSNGRRDCGEESKGGGKGRRSRRMKRKTSGKGGKGGGKGLGALLLSRRGHI